MKFRRVMSVMALISLLALIGAAVGCARGGTVGMMEKIPENASDFGFTDVKALRGDGDLEDIYDAWIDDYEDTLEDYGIDCDDVNRIASGGGVMLYEGDFDLDGVRNELEDRDYDDDEYKGVEVWKDYEWVALMGNLIITGSEEAVKDCIKVIKEGEDSLADDRDAGDVMHRLPTGIWLSYSTYETYEDLEANGYSFGKKDEDTLRMTWVLRFRDEDAAEDAMEEIEDDLAEEPDFKHVDVDQDGEFVMVTADIDIEDFWG